MCTDTRILTNKDQIKPGQILLVKTWKKGKIHTVEKIIKSLDELHQGVRYNDNSWVYSQQLIDSGPVLIGYVKPFLKFFSYRSYF